MQHMGHKHGGQQLLPDSVGQLRWLDRAACVACGTIRSQRCRRCNLCGRDTPLRELRVGDTFQDRRQAWHQDAAAGGPATRQQLPQSSQPVPPGEPLDDSPLPNCSIGDVVLTGRDKYLLTELRRASAMALPRCVVSRYATAWEESLEGATSGHQSWALLCRCRCRLLRAGIPKGVDRNSELKQRLQPWESGQINALIGLVLWAATLWAASQNSKKDAATDRCTAWETSMCHDSPRPVSKAMKGLVGGAAQGSADCRRKWTTALIPRSSGTGTHSPMWSVPRRLESPGVEGDTNWRGAG